MTVNRPRDPQTGRYIKAVVPAKTVTAASLSAAIKKLGYTRHVAPKAQYDAMGNMRQSGAKLTGFKVRKSYGIAGNLDVTLYADAAGIQALADKLTELGYKILSTDTWSIEVAPVR